MGEQIDAHVQELGGRALLHRVTSYGNDSLVASDDASLIYEIEYNCWQAGRFRGEPGRCSDHRSK